ncbi:hypothetical protein STEG23_001046 [Scotinomys teguina]
MFTSSIGVIYGRGANTITVCGQTNRFKGFCNQYCKPGDLTQHKSILSDLESKSQNPSVANVMILFMIQYDHRPHDSIAMIS